MMNAPTSPEHRVQWWLATDGQPEGPHGAEHVAAALRAGTLRPTALACPVGGAEWKPVTQWAEFREVVREAPPCLIPSVHDSPITNSRLPGFANAICVYAIAVSPGIWILQNLSCYVGGLPYKEDSDALMASLLVDGLSAFLSLITTAVLALGGVRLRAGRQSGRTILMTGIWICLAFGLLSFLGTFGIAVLATAEEETETTGAGAAIAFLRLTVGLAELAFLILSFVWLRSSGRQLALSP